jgi:predicted small integral membrane protein
MGMTSQQRRRPRGFLPMDTNLFDRIFIGVVLSIALHLLWMRFVEQVIPLTVATVLSVILIYVIAKWG